ncbi:hypothetical protein EF847_01150 [Actinobacteria bacterium YIM 96077]|uniref:Type II toxin-antitoxin system PemK/MazF family toxin n=1 Tax=Phytoactinopolyspora halophila TaxID=1981511 RepID=A0A329R0T7_9ACTN|nr:hypothetical protein EF847_01150 [Actinobacteria bacterium YIM 96077]RAW17983.1 hypothetical protein DPM12_03855 [Phytoactinopolyspora halophila]
MNPGEIWRLEDQSLRLVLSNATYNTSQLNQVITAVVRSAPPAGFQPFAVDTPHGVLLPDRLAMHPRHWLVEHVATVDAGHLAAVRQHLAFLVCDL